MAEVLEIKIKPTCGNCRFVFSLENDPEEEERCKLVGRFNQAKVNPLAKKYNETTGATDMCEYHKPVERLKERIDYTA